MSILKQVKGVLKSEEVSQLIVEFVNGSTQEYSLKGKSGSKSAVKDLIKSIKWEDVAEVQFVIDEEDEDDEDEDDEDNND